MFNLFKTKRQAGGSDVSGLVAIAFMITLIAAWITHIVVCLKTASWGFLIAGAIFFPVAIIHGIGIWFGAF